MSEKKLKTALAGALAAGGDPATSPLYVFGPLLRLIVPAGVAAVTFGPSIWLVVLTVSTVSLVYRLVIRWITDGTGGSGLSEEEFGGWAGKINASITLVEYSLTFLVSMSALITFLSDRLPFLNEQILGLELRLIAAFALSVLTCALVARGPRVAALSFGPATAGVLVLLWIMIGATIWRFGLELPPFSLSAFRGELLGYTLGGYARILALMTGIEVFANLVNVYDGDAAQRSRRSFQSLLIVMISTSATMLILGPVILRMTDPTRTDVSVFTQVMDALLPGPLAYLGTAVSVAVLLSACATALQGIAHLAHGLGHRHYMPSWLSRPNRFGIAGRSIWLLLIVISICFWLFGTREETYLALYAAGVFVILSMTGWAAAKRLLRDVRTSSTTVAWVQILAVIVAASLTTLATVVIFIERFREGAWLYLVLTPVLYGFFTVIRKSKGVPSPKEDDLGKQYACLCPGQMSPDCHCSENGGCTCHST